MPEFEVAYTTTEGFTILAVNMMESPAAVSDYVDELGLTFPIALDRSGSVTNLYRVVAYPSTYVIDADGIILAFNAGPADARQVQEWVALASE
jgi:peroxiredoxin